MADWTLRADGQGVAFGVRVVPRASRAAIVGVHDGALKVTLTSPPVDGAANAALIELLSDLLGVPKRAVAITAGQRSKHKTVHVQGVTEAQVLALIAADT